VQKFVEGLEEWRGVKDEQNQETKAKNVFRKSGGVYEVKFGNLIGTCADLEGCKYLRVLLASPGRLFSPDELEIAAQRLSPKQRGELDAIMKSGARGKVSSDADFQQLKKERDALERRLQSESDPASKAELQEELDAANQLLNSCSRPTANGKPKIKNERTPRDALANRITTYLARCREALGEDRNLNVLVDFLKEHVKREDGSFEYRKPDGVEEWETE